MPAPPCRIGDRRHAIADQQAVGLHRARLGVRRSQPKRSAPARRHSFSDLLDHGRSSAGSASAWLRNRSSTGRCRARPRARPSRIPGREPADVAGRAHRRRRVDVQPDQPIQRREVVATVEHRVVEQLLGVLLVAGGLGDGVVDGRNQAAVALGAERHALDGVGAVTDAVVHLRRVSTILTGRPTPVPPSPPGSRAATSERAAEGAADERRDHPDVLLGMPKVSAT